MDTTPIYDLRERLRAAAMAGTNLLSEDFRLRRAYEAFRPLEAASSVFAKAGQLTARLLSPDCQNPQGALLDAIALADAVICTLGAVDVTGEIVSFDTIHAGETAADVIVNAPCSKVKPLVEALTTSGSGNYSFVSDMHDSSPEIFDDFRVQYAMVQALGASYAELAEMVKGWLENEGETIIPLLKKEFDPKGKKGMVRRLQLIAKIAGAAENDFYIEMLKTATGEVRSVLIEALRYEPANTDLLLDMQKTEKGKNRQIVQNMLALMEDERCYGLFHEMAAKKPSEACETLLPSTTDCASRVIAELCTKQLSDIAALPQDAWGSAEADKEMELLCQTVQALIGKHGDGVCACYRELLSHKDLLEQAGRRKVQLDLLRFPEGTICKTIFSWAKIRLDGLGDYKLPVRSRELSWELGIGSLMAQSLVVCPDENLREMALELYENRTEKTKNINFLTAATVVKILGREDCTGWLEANAAGQSELDEMERAFVCFMWNRKANSYVVDMEYLHVQGGSLSYRPIFRKVEIPHAKKIADWMMRHSSKSTDAILNRWIDTTDAGECEKYGRYFYERASAIVDNEEYLRYMRNCGWKKCKGLGTDYVKIKVTDGLWMLNEYLHNLPGDEQALLEETSAVADLIRSGEVELSHLSQLSRAENIEIWANHLKDLTVYNALRDRR